MANAVDLYNVTDPKYRGLNKNIKMLRTKQPLPTDSHRVRVRQDLYDGNPYDLEPEVYCIVYVIEGDTHTKNLVALCNDCGMDYTDIEVLLPCIRYNNGLYVYLEDKVECKILIRKLFEYMIKHGYSKPFKE